MSNDNCSNQTSIPITSYYPDRGSTSDWSYREGNLLQPPELGSDTSSIWSFALVFQTSFRGETSGESRNVWCLLRLCHTFYRFCK